MPPLALIMNHSLNEQETNKRSQKQILQEKLIADLEKIVE